MFIVAVERGLVGSNDSQEILRKMVLKIRLSPLGLIRMVVVKEQKERLKNKESYESRLKLLSHV